MPRFHPSASLSVSPPSLLTPLPPRLSSLDITAPGVLMTYPQVHTAGQVRSGHWLESEASPRKRPPIPSPPLLCWLRGPTKAAPIVVVVFLVSEIHLLSEGSFLVIYIFFSLKDVTRSLVPPSSVLDARRRKRSRGMRWRRRRMKRRKQIGEREKHYFRRS